ncbi:Hypothetical predicted protein [Octopus vulgaris]|uniref:Uncharacterized protein n=1 Tax=Octopus vulgaris TaxID=6645 RepID=A0AA36AZ59_OCTVU|nr:Hypothetical predicted protein [Octopus vulgaris]
MQKANLCDIVQPIKKYMKSSAQISEAICTVSNPMAICAIRLEACDYRRILRREKLGLVEEGWPEVRERLEKEYSGHTGTNTATCGKSLTRKILTGIGRMSSEREEMVAFTVLECRN